MSIGLTVACYEKTKVRGVFRIAREGKWHNIVEYCVDALLESEIVTRPPLYLFKGTSYTEADKLQLGSCYYRFYQEHYILSNDLNPINIYFSLQFSPKHPLSYSQLREVVAAPMNILYLQAHGSAGKDKLVGKVTAGISDLLVLKFTGSAFEYFHRDVNTTLLEVNDRIFSTSVDPSYGTFAPYFHTSTHKREQTRARGASAKGGRRVHRQRVPLLRATLLTFILNESPSVQAALKKTSRCVVAEDAIVNSASPRLRGSNGSHSYNTMYYFPSISPSGHWPEPTLILRRARLLPKFCPLLLKGLQVQIRKRSRFCGVLSKAEINGVRKSQFMNRQRDRGSGLAVMVAPYPTRPEEVFRNQTFGLL
ncbi:hypothetical protein CPC08DRAFT_728505 [Agrocybe pediades]|nr:hypothetical protein CPC08DRAFT_728505 [Agrocybe pediades]